MAGIDLPDSVVVADRICTEEIHEDSVGHVFAKNTLTKTRPTQTKEVFESQEAPTVDSDNDPLGEFWNEQRMGPDSLIPGLIELDQEWKPYYDELVHSGSYQLIQYFRGAARGLSNYIEILAPVEERKVFQNAVIDYINSDNDLEGRLLKLDPNLIQYAKPLRKAVKHPEFHRVRVLIDKIYPLIHHSIDSREIIAEELARDGGAGSAFVLMYESSQMRRFVESTQLNVGFKNLVSNLAL